MNEGPKRGNIMEENLMSDEFRQHIERINKKAEKIGNSYTFVFTTTEGKAVLADLKQMWGIEEPFGADLSSLQVQYRIALLDAWNYIQRMMTPEK